MVNKTGSFILLILLTLSQAANASIKSFVTKSEVNKGQPVELVIDVSTIPRDAQINIASLSNDFDFVGSSQRSSTNIINGKTTVRNEIVLTLIPKSVGALQIPSISIDNEKTLPHAITVTENTRLNHNKTNGDNSDIFIKTSLSRDSAFVQQQMIYTVKLYRNVNIYNPQLTAPNAMTGEASFEEISEPTDYAEMVNGVEYYVHETSYAVIPSKSGSLVIAPSTLTADIEDRSRRNDIFGNSPFADSFFSNSLLSRGARKRIQVESLPSEVMIKAIPSSFKAADWLPAQLVTIDEHWNDSDVEVGQPISRTIKVSAVGLAANQIPELVLPKIKGAKQYATPAIREQRIVDGKLVSIVTTDVTIIPSYSGQLSFPAIELPWWDTNKNVQRMATLASVAKGVAGNAPKPSEVLPEAKNESVITLDEPAPDKMMKYIHLVVSYVKSYWVWVVSVLSLALLLVIYKTIGNKKADHIEPSLFGARTPSDNNEVAKISRSLMKDFKKACNGNDAQHARTALLSIGRVLWPEHTNFNLNTMKLLVPEELNNEITVLNHALYNQDSKGWKGCLLKESTVAYIENSSNSVEKTALRPLIIESV